MGSASLLLVLGIAIGVICALGLLAGRFISRGMTLKRWQQIDTGMTYDEVCELLGGPGRTISTSIGLNGGGGANVEWSQRHLGGSEGFGVVTFTEGRVSGKSQRGLR